jgi:Ca-activated chloride channel family protein
MLAAAGLLRAQTPDAANVQAPDPAATLTVKVQVVAIDAVVRNKQTGELAPQLDKDSFTLRVDGKPAEIKYFNRDNDLPLTIGLLVDTSGSEREFFDDEAVASDVFLRDTLRPPDDRAFVIRFDTEVLLLQKMTSSLRDLHNALQLLSLQREPVKGAKHSGGTLLFDAIQRASIQVIGKEPGRRALVVLTDGDDNGSITDIDWVIRAAQLENVAVYSVLYTNDVSGGIRFDPVRSAPRPSGVAGMALIARATGGRSFIVGMGTPVSEIFAAIAADLRTQYRIGFTPAASKPGKQHSLELRAKDKQLAVQARTGYITPQ